MTSPDVESSTTVSGQRPAPDAASGGRRLRVVVVGAGIAGLSAAHRLLNRARSLSIPLDVVLLESARRSGGAIQTTTSEGLVMEHGPDSLISTKPAAEALIRELGLADQIVGTNPDHRRSYVVRRHTLHPVPEGFYLLAPTSIGPFLSSRLFSWPGKLRMALDLVLPRSSSRGDESLASFVRRRLGQEALERMAQPMVGGIYSADPEVLSLEATMPQFLELERKYRSVIIGLVRSGRLVASARGERAVQSSGARYGLFLSLAAGLGLLARELTDSLPSGCLWLSTRVCSIERDQDQGFLVHTAGPEGGAVVRANAVIVAAPGPTTAKLLMSLDSRLAELVGATPYSSVATVNLAFEEGAIPPIPHGAGLVIPAREPGTMMACTFSSQKYPGRAPGGWVLLRAFVGGALHPEAYERDDDDLVEGVLADLRRLIGIEARPLEQLVSRHPESMPQYLVGHLDRIRKIEERLSRFPFLGLAGNAYVGVSVPDCILSGERAAQRVLDALAAPAVRGSTGEEGTT